MACALCFDHVVVVVGGGVRCHCHENVSGVIIVHDIIMKYFADHNCAGH